MIMHVYYIGQVSE